MEAQSHLPEAQEQDLVIFAENKGRMFELLFATFDVH